MIPRRKTEQSQRFGDWWHVQDEGTKIGLVAVAVITLCGFLVVAYWKGYHDGAQYERLHPDRSSMEAVD
jgi:hypothetical protein